jgi:transcriptional regulator with PAS, ATPase and Fis domain
MLSQEMTGMDWSDDFGASITICDRQGIVVYMNKVSREQFSTEGGENLIGKSLIDCHPEPARSRLLEMLDHPEVNIYTIEKRGKKKLIVQKPWMLKDQFNGVVEISFEIPYNMPHFIRV